MCGRRRPAPSSGAGSCRCPLTCAAASLLFFQGVRPKQYLLPDKPTRQQDTSTLWQYYQWAHAQNGVALRFIGTCKFLHHGKVTIHKRNRQKHRHRHFQDLDRWDQWLLVNSKFCCQFRSFFIWFCCKLFSLHFWFSFLFFYIYTLFLPWVIFRLWFFCFNCSLSLFLLFPITLLFSCHTFSFGY